MRKYLLGVLLLALSPWCHAVCPDPELTKPWQVRIDAPAALLVVHASASFDARYATKRGVDEAIRFAKEKKMPVIYLVEDGPIDQYMMNDCRPDHWIYSQGGEIRFEMLPNHLYVVGGHLEMCLSTALNEIIYQWAKQPMQDRQITYFMDAIYSNGKVIDPSDPFYKDFNRFMDVVTYGRPGGEHWPKLTLLETMGIIVREEHELEYIRQILPRWDSTFSPEYRIEVRLNGSSRKVLRDAPGWDPSTMLFHFVDSAFNLSLPQCYLGLGSSQCMP